MAETNTVQKTTFVYDTQGVTETKQKVEQLAGSLDKLETTQKKVSDTEGKSATSSEKAAQAKARYEERVARAQRQIEMEARAMDLARAAQDASALSLQGLSDAQMRAAQAAAQASAQQRSAANDNVQALEKQNSAFSTAGKFALAHPTLVLAGTALAAGALSRYATVASTSLGAASTATAAYAATAGEMGAGVVAGATVAARGLGIASSAAGVAATGFAKYAETAGSLTTATGLLTRGLGALPAALGPIGVAFLVFETGRTAINKAYDDLAKLIELGQKARDLDLSASFVKGFEGLGKQIGATTEQMDKALQTATAFVKDQYGGPNAALKQISQLYTDGAFGAQKPASMSSLETATSEQEKIRATASAVKDLLAVGQDLAALDLTGKLFGQEVVDRMRAANLSAEQIASAVQNLTDKEIIKQDQVDRALELNKNIADTKQAISDAVAVTFDFSAAAIAANEAWLKILQAVQWVLEKVNQANAASADLVGTLTTKMLDGIKTAGSAAATVAADLAVKYGVIAKQQPAAEVQGPPEAAGPAYKITAKQFPYNFGPTLSDVPKANEAAKQAKQAATEAASSYDLLIKRTEDRISELNLEADSVGKTRDAVIKLKLAHDLERAAQKDGTEVTAQMREEWDRLGNRLAASTSRLEDNRRAFELMREGQRALADDFSSFVTDIVTGGQKMEQAFASLAKTLANDSLKALLTGEGPIGDVAGEDAGLCEAFGIAPRAA